MTRSSGELLNKYEQERAASWELIEKNHQILLDAQSPEGYEKQYREARKINNDFMEKSKVWVSQEAENTYSIKICIPVKRSNRRTTQDPSSKNTVSVIVPNASQMQTNTSQAQMNNTFTENNERLICLLEMVTESSIR